MEKIYEGFDASTEVEPTAWREVLRLMNEATVEGLSQSQYTTHEEKFLGKLRHSNEVFSAFKVHSMGAKMQERLHDSNGNLRSFEEWRKAVQPIASHQVGSWLRTEYDTAVLRAHQASDWQEFEANKDIFPNLRWMPTTSPSPEASHEAFWSSGLTLPIDDPFWASNHPGNRWNCKCSLEATDEQATAPIEPDEKSKPQRGLENNPRDGEIFSDKHPYFPENCKACPFYSPGGGGGVYNLIKGVFSNKKKDCYSCPYVDDEVAKAKYPEQHKQFLELLEDPNYKDVEFDPQSGGVKATHIGHNTKSTKDRYFGEENLKSSDLEKECVDILFKSGRKVVLLDESTKGADGNTLSALDLSVNNKIMDIRSITENRSNYVNALTAKNKQLKSYNERSDVGKSADSVCLYFHDPAMFSKKKIKHTIESYNNLTIANGTKQIKKVVVVVNSKDGGKVIVFNT